MKNHPNPPIPTAGYDDFVCKALDGNGSWVAMGKSWGKSWENTKKNMKQTL